MNQEIRRYNHHDVNVNGSRRMFGVIISYGNRNGWIRTSENKDVFLSSWDLEGRKQEKKIHIGTLVEFELNWFEKKPIATKIEIIMEYPREKYVIKLEGLKIKLRNVERFGIRNIACSLPCIFDESDINKYTYDQYRYMYVTLRGGDEYKFFNIDSPVKCDGKIDVDKTYYKLMSKIMQYDALNILGMVI